MSVETVAEELQSHLNRGERRCSRCQRWLPASSFIRKIKEKLICTCCVKRRGGSNNPPLPVGLRHLCRKCQSPLGSREHQECRKKQKAIQFNNGLRNRQNKASRKAKKFAARALVAPQKKKSKKRKTRERLGRSPRDYQDYLISAHWKKFKEDFYAENERRCVCGSRLNINLHHKNYRCLGSETFEDVVALCRDHHGEVHAFAKANPNLTLSEATDDFLGLLGIQEPSH